MFYPTSFPFAWDCILQGEGQHSSSRALGYSLNLFSLTGRESTLNSLNHQRGGQVVSDSQRNFWKWEENAAVSRLLGKTQKLHLRVTFKALVAAFFFFIYLNKSRAICLDTFARLPALYLPNSWYNGPGHFYLLLVSRLYLLWHFKWFHCSTPIQLHC